MRGIFLFLLLTSTLIYYAFQPVQDQVNSARKEYLENTVHLALTQAQIEGDFTASDLQNMQQSIASTLGYPTSSVQISGTETPENRGNPIRLTVSVPTHLAFLRIENGGGLTEITASASVNSEAILT